MLLVSVCAFANCDYPLFNPYLGIDSKWQKIGLHKDWKRAVENKRWGTTFFLGNRFCDYLGLELGYSQTTRKIKAHLFAPGEDFFNNGDTAGAIMRTTTRFNSYHIDVNSYWPINPCIDLIGSLGYGWVQPKVSVDILTLASPSLNPNLPINTGFFLQDATTLTTIQGRDKGVFRVGAGAQFMICDFVGIRGLVRLETTNSLRLKGDFERRDPNSTIEFGNVRRMFKDSYSVALGIFWNFE